MIYNLKKFKFPDIFIIFLSDIFGKAQLHDNTLTNIYPDDQIYIYFERVISIDKKLTMIFFYYKTILTIEILDTLCDNVDDMISYYFTLFNILFFSLI